MRRGLVIGKFLPVHQGHLALIRFAATQCDELIVSMSYTTNDPIDHTQRLQWLRTLLTDDASIKIFEVLDDFDDESLSLEERTKIWAAFIGRTYARIDILFSSEEYGEPFARNLNARHILFDQSRAAIPVSASRIRHDPFKYWAYIPDAVRPYFVKKICIYGPESTGKSTLTQNLAKRYKTDFVPEVAREMLVTNNFSVDDIVNIGLKHAERIRQKERVANKLLFCDTDVITTQIYSSHYLNAIPEILHTLEKETVYAHYFLLDIDVPWIADGLRDLGDRRVEMFRIFRQALDNRGLAYTLVQGDFLNRINVVERWIAQNLNLYPEE